MLSRSTELPRIPPWQRWEAASLESLETITQFMLRFLRPHFHAMVRWMAVTTLTPRLSAKLSTSALLTELVVWPSTASSVPTELSSTRTTSSATGAASSPAGSYASPDSAPIGGYD